VRKTPSATAISGLVTCRSFSVSFPVGAVVVVADPSETVGSGCSRWGVCAEPAAGAIATVEASAEADVAAAWFDCCDSDACAARSLEATNLPGPFREVMLLLLSSFLPWPFTTR